jgi:hypothetical protein
MTSTLGQRGRTAAWMRPSPAACEWNRREHTMAAR